MQKATILIFTNDGYAVCWEPFCHGISKYWPECPFDYYFITNYQDPPCGGAIKVGDDTNFTSKMKTALSTIQTPYVIHTHEDNWISQPVNTQNILDYIELMEKDKADYIRLASKPGPDQDFAFDSRLGINNNDAPYRASLQAAIWRKSVYYNLLNSGESPWQFEVVGSIRSRMYGDRFLSVKRRSYGMSYVNAVADGMWTPEGREYLKREGLTIDLSALSQPARSKRARVFLFRLREKMRKSALQNRLYGAGRLSTNAE
jgi:hypothetical protein